MSTNNKWGALSMRDRAFLIREAVRNGITDINSIRNTWEHRFDGGSNQLTEEKPWYKKLASAISEGSRMARDARIGAVGAEQVRELYREGKTVEAQELAKQYAKANIAGMTMAAGAANTAGLAGDLATTGVSTLADTAVEGNTDNLIQDLGVNAAFDILGHGTGKIINKIIENTPVVPSNIEDVLKYLKRSDSRGLDKDNLVSMINNASNEELDELLKLTRYSGDWGLIAPLVYIKKGDLRSFAISLSDAMYAMRHGSTPNSKFIEEATNLIKENWNKYIKEGGDNKLHLYGIDTELLPAKKYVAHGISTSNFRKAIDRGGEAIMPSFSILPQNTDSKWGDILFLGKKGLLDNTKIYPSDAWTPTVSMVKDINNKTNQQVLDEMMSIQNKREIPQISLEDVDNINWNMEMPADKVKNQNSFTSWFMNQVSTTSIPGTIPYMEAKYQGNLPFSSFNHMIIPEDAMDAIEWAEKNKMPYSVYGDYNIGDKKRRYPTLQQVLNDDDDLLFKNGGYINHQFSGIESDPSEDPGIWDTIKGWFSKEEPKYITKDNYKEELSKFRNAFEEYHSQAYWDSKGKKWTVGTGLTYLIDDNGKEIPVRKGQRLSEAENQEQIIRRVNRDEDYARKKTPYWDNYHPELKFQILEAMYNAGNANVWEKSPKYQQALRRYEEAKGWRDRDYDLKDIFQHADWNLSDRKWLGVRSRMRRNPQAINPDDYSKIYYNHFRDSLRTVYDKKFIEK